MTEHFYYTAYGEKEAVKKGHFDRQRGKIARFAGEILTDGKTARAWERRGYVERKKEYSFLITRPTADNWTPAGLLRSHADVMQLQTATTKYFETLLIVNGFLFEYDHIEKLETAHGFDRMRVYLTEKKGF